jgi:uncharacterized protein YdeI (YjbR/CyaY-like superfamily)
MTRPRKPIFFPDPQALRRWFARHAASKRELVVGYMKRGSGVPSVTWPESVDEALCVGWIDGVRHRIDDVRYQIRFSPRRRGSYWSNVNIRRVAALKKTGRMKAAGLAVFAARDRSQPARGSYEQKRRVRLAPQHLREIRRDAAAWKYYRAVPPGYRQLVNWWIVSAKKPETQAKRLRTLIKACAEGRRLGW